MAKYTVIYHSKNNEMPYSLYCEPHPGVTLEDALKDWDIKEDEIQFIFEGWPRRVSLMKLFGDNDSAKGGS